MHEDVLEEARVMVDSCDLYSSGRRNEIVNNLPNTFKVLGEIAQRYRYELSRDQEAAIDQARAFIASHIVIL